MIGYIGATTIPLPPSPNLIIEKIWDIFLRKLKQQVYTKNFDFERLEN